MTVSAMLDTARSASFAGDHARLPRRTSAPQQGAAVARRPADRGRDLAVLREASDDRHGYGLRVLIVVLSRGGLRVAEALALGERDFDPGRGSLPVRNGKGGRRREIGMDAWGSEQLSPWPVARIDLPVGPAVLRRRRPHPRAALVERQRPRRPAARRPSGRAAPIRAAPAAPRPCRQARPRERAAQRHPAPARPRQPRRHLDLPPRDRHRRDHRHRPRPGAHR
jgi:hypothetical protein